MINYSDVLNTIDRFTEDDLTKSIINSVNENQIKSKTWLIDKLKPHLEMFDNPKICVAAGWYGLSAQLLSTYTTERVISFDIDPMCKDIGKKMFSNVKFETADISEYDISNFDIIVCTSCEHITDEVLNSFIKKKKTASLMVLQSNNYFDIKEHINCKNSIEEFKKSVNLNVLDDYIMSLNKFDRYMIIGL